MKCNYKYEKLSSPYTESKVYSEEISKQQGGVYCSIDDLPCKEDCTKHFYLKRRKENKGDSLCQKNQ